MRKRILPIISCLALISVPVFCLIALSRHCYNSLENLYIDKIYTVFSTTSFSQFTSFTNIVGSVFSLFLLPFFVLKVIDSNYKFTNSIQFIITIVRRNYILVLIFVTFVMFPSSFIGGATLKEALDFCFLKENIFTHILSPIFFFVATHLYAQEKTNIKESLFMFVPSIVYCVLYTVMVYGVKTWEDFYYTLKIYEILGHFTFPITFILLIGANFLVMFLDNLVTQDFKKI